MSGTFVLSFWIFILEKLLYNLIQKNTGTGVILGQRGKSPEICKSNLLKE